MPITPMLRVASSISVMRSAAARNATGSPQPAHRLCARSERSRGVKSSTSLLGIVGGSLVGRMPGFMSCHLARGRVEGVAEPLVHALDVEVGGDTEAGPVEGE